jgi:TctA family transporter
LFEAAGSALVQLAEPTRLGYLLLGVVLGLAVGVIPGLGSITVLAILLPFTFKMDTATALALILGIAPASFISDTVPAVLFAIPGEVGSQATMMDGYPMSRKGQAGRALGAAYFSNLIGGLFGAIVLMGAAFVLQPVVRRIGSPEIFAMALLGISMVGALSSGAMVRGIAVGFLGMALATVGLAVGSATERYTFGTLYLWDGLEIIAVTLGLFGLVEIADLVIQGKGVATGAVKVTLNPLVGMKDVLHNKWLVMRSSILGCFLGAVPGIGAAVIGWLAYAHAVQTEKNPENFGKGDIRGVIAPEAANNARDGGQAIPSLAFGVPGGLGWALILTALIIQGIRPGPDLFNERLDIVFLIGWSLALANVFAVLITLSLTPLLARLSLVPIRLLSPVAIGIIVLAAYQVTSSWGNLLLLLLSGLLGWVMKRAGWPRPPLVIGLILGRLVERYGITAFGRYGVTVLLRPGVLIILAVAVSFIAWSFRRHPTLGQPPAQLGKVERQ